MSESFRKKRISATAEGSRKVLKLDEKWEVLPVLADEFTQDAQTVPVYIAEIINLKHTSKLVKMLSEVQPLGQLQHLKRVRSQTVNGSQRLDIILMQCRESHKGDSIQVKDLLPEGYDLPGLADTASIHFVAKRPPLTRKQYNESVALWPTQFHEDKYLARVLNNQLFSEEDLKNMGEHMKLALTLENNSLEGRGAVVVNPSSNCVLATAKDNRDKHPLQHAVMVAIDLVAKNQGGGSWSLLAGYESTGDVLNSDVDVPYLCTGYDIYVSREPCTMCAMALVHSRIRRVFYNLNSCNGALGSKLKLHTRQGLNHHFEVWRLFVRKQH